MYFDSESYYYDMSIEDGDEVQMRLTGINFDTFDNTDKLIERANMIFYSNYGDYILKEINIGNNGSSTINCIWKL